MKMNTRSLTEGNPIKLIILFAMPVFLGRLFQMVYSLVDTKIVGSILGEAALAAVGSVGILYNLINGFLSGMTLGFSVIVAQNFGSGNMKLLKRNVAATTVLSLGSTTMIVVLVMLFLKPILHIMNVPKSQFEMAYAYIGILIVGMFVTAAYNACADVLRAIGDSVTPLVFLVIASILNVILDCLFVAVFEWGVEGAAYATVLAQFLSVVLCLIHIKRNFPLLQMKKSDFVMEKQQVSLLMYNGLSMGLMSCLMNFGTLILQTGVNQLGQTIIVAHTAARKVFEIFGLPISVLGSSMATYCGQNYGAKKYDRIRVGMKSVLGIGFILSVIILILSFTVSPHLIGFVASTKETEILYWGSMYLKCNMIFEFVCVVIVILRNSMQGFGDQKTPVFSSFVELVGKVIFTLIFVKIYGYWGVIWTEPVVWILMVIPLIVMTIKNPVMKEKDVEV